MAGGWEHTLILLQVFDSLQIVSKCMCIVLGFCELLSFKDCVPCLLCFNAMKILQSGRVLSCGSGYKDSRRSSSPPVLGNGGSERQLTPIAVATLANVNVAHVGCGKLR